MISERVRFMPDVIVDKPPVPTTPLPKEGAGELPATPRPKSTKPLENVENSKEVQPEDEELTLIASMGPPDGPGGLTRGVKPLVKGKAGAVWVFAASQNGNAEHGGAEEALRTTEKTAEGNEVTKLGIFFSQDTKDRAYLHVANNILWPALHDLPQRIESRNEEPIDFQAYKELQQRFAEIIAKELKKAKEMKKPVFSFLNDYQIAGVALELRNMGFTEERLGFFLHTPFPKTESFLHLHHDIQKYFLEGLLAHDYVGFQTEESKQNFLDAVKIVLGPPEEPEDKADSANVEDRVDNVTYLTEDNIQTVNGVTYITWNGRRVLIEDNPIGIDTQAFKEEASKESVREKIEVLKDRYKDQKVILSLSRRDYTKGLPQLLEANDLLFEEHPEETLGKLAVIIAAPPTRPDLAQYQKYSIAVETQIREMNEKYWFRNGEWSPKIKEIIERYGLENKIKTPKKDWSPVDYLPEGLGGDDLFAGYGITDILVTPSTADGFILAVPEAISAWEGQGKDDGVIITGATIGANQVYGEGVLTVVPQRVGTERLTDEDRATDSPIRAFNQREEEKVKAYADTLYEAITMPEEKRKTLMQKLREINEEHNVEKWGTDIRTGTMGEAPLAAA